MVGKTLHPEIFGNVLGDLYPLRMQNNPFRVYFG